VAELVLGSTPAATPGVVDGAARDRRLRQVAATPSAALAQPERYFHGVPMLCATSNREPSCLVTSPQARILHWSIDRKRIEKKSAFCVSPLT